MRVNSRVFTERTDMLNAIQIPNCPSQFRAIAENILMMATKPGYSVSDYNTMTELDKILMLDYWREYDGMTPTVVTPALFGEWFKKHATAPELIRRSREWLAQKNYIFIKPDVQQRAYEAGTKFSRSVKRK